MITIVALHAPTKLLDRYKLNQLSEYELAVIHEGLLVNLSTRQILPRGASAIQIDPAL
jgi:hypothetical protein